MRLRLRPRLQNKKEGRLFCRAQLLGSTAELNDEVSDGGLFFS